MNVYFLSCWISVSQEILQSSVEISEWTHYPPVIALTCQDTSEVDAIEHSCQTLAHEPNLARGVIVFGPQSPLVLSAIGYVPLILRIPECSADVSAQNSTLRISRRQ